MTSRRGFRPSPIGSGRIPAAPYYNVGAGEVVSTDSSSGFSGLSPLTPDPMAQSPVSSEVNSHEGPNTSGTSGQHPSAQVSGNTKKRHPVGLASRATQHSSGDILAPSDGYQLHPGNTTLSRSPLIPRHSPPIPIDPTAAPQHPSPQATPGLPPMGSGDLQGLRPRTSSSAAATTNY